MIKSNYIKNNPQAGVQNGLFNYFRTYHQIESNDLAYPAQTKTNIPRHFEPLTSPPKYSHHLGWSVYVKDAS
jgi:hypothetical protein